jgi:hypothetical protein
MSLTLAQFEEGKNKVKINYNSIKAESSINKIDFNVTQKRRGKPVIKVGRRFRNKNLDFDVGARVQGKKDYSIGFAGSYKW